LPPPAPPSQASTWPPTSAPDRRHRLLACSQAAAEPGSSYHYAGGNTYVLGRIVHSITGLDLRDFLVPRLFDPLGIRNPQWLRCPLGFPLGAIGLQLRTSEITRITQLLLHEGTLGPHRLIPGDYIARMTTDTTGTGRAAPDNRT
jgi:CubicO group peptidase (beta-lactamase class C family)